ncbi:MAG: M14 family metallopeptidase [Vicinamibacterales bacterium]
MPVGRAARFVVSLAGLAAAMWLVQPQVPVAAAPSVPTPEQFIGFKVGADTKLARWDRIVEYMKQVAAGSDRVRYRELGKTNDGNPFVMLEISAPETLKNLDRYKQYQRKLYFQNGAPSVRERDEIFRQGKAVVLVGASIHATEVGATQMTLELVHHLATDDSPATRKILDNVILLLVPSLNPDGQILVTDWYNRNLGTPYESSPLPVLYHPYVGHDNNRDMYMFTQKESQYIAQVAWHDWIPAVWLDEHQMGAGGPRIFVMPATDPINPNVHPLIYRWNAIFGQSQAAALEAAGKDGIIYNSTYTNFWQGAMAWSGWWHNQVGLLTEVASVRIASPTDQIKTAARTTVQNDFAREAAMDAIVPGLGTLGAPIDTTPRTEYPRPWMGGHWTLRDIVDYQLIATMALIDTAADRREAILRQIYEVNRQTIEDGRTGRVKAILIPMELQQDPREAAHLAERLMMGGVEIYRAEAAFTVDDRPGPSRARS